VSPGPTATPTRVPVVASLELPGVVCSAATQLRAWVETPETFPVDTPARWMLRDGADRRVDEGTWVVRDGVILVPFPDNQPLVPGDYALDLIWDGTTMARSSFSIRSDAPTVTRLSLHLVPGGASVSRLPPDARVIYLGYAFEGVCAGAPYWITMRDAVGSVVCSDSGLLATLDGTGEVACYHDDGRPFPEGAYTVTLTLMDEVPEVLGFAVEVEPTHVPPPPTPTATPRPVVCTPLFTAAGLAVGGEAFRPLTLFDWYTQVVYAGSACEHLLPHTTWRSTWWHEGEMIRQATGKWHGPSEGVVWDSLTGQVDSPFLRSGAYTVTLEIDGEQLDAGFSIFAYEPQVGSQAESPDEPQAEPPSTDGVEE